MRVVVVSWSGATLTQVILASTTIRPTRVHSRGRPTIVVAVVRVSATIHICEVR